MNKIFFRLFFILNIFLVGIVMPEKKNFKKSTESFQQTIKTLDMDQAVQLAYQNKPDLKAAKFDIQASKEGEKAAIAGYYPTVNFTENASFQSKSSGITNDIGVNASQLVYSFAGPIERRNIQKQITEQAKYGEEALKDLVRFQVENSFLKSWLLQRKNNVIQNLKNSATQTFKKAEHENKLNLLGKNDWLKNTASYAQDMATIYLYTDDLSIAQSEFEYYIGTKIDSENEKTKLVWNDKKEITLKQLDDYQKFAIKNRKDLKVKQKEADQYMAQEKFYKRSNLPTISISGQSGVTTVPETSYTHEFNQAGINLSWNLFDGTVNHHNQKQSHAQKLKATLEKEELLQKIRFEVTKTYNELNQQLKILVAKNIEYTQAKNEFELNKQKYEIGEISKVDFDLAKTNWQNKKFEWLSTKVSIAAKERELNYVCGYPENL